MKRTKEDAELTRQTLLDAAWEIFNKEGFAKTTLEEIAKEAKVTRGAIYWHFKNKLEIFRAISEESFNNVKDRILPIIESQMDPLEKIQTLLRELFLIVSEEKRFQIIEEIETFRYEKKKELREFYCNHREKVTELRSKIVDILQTGIRSGVFNPVLIPDVAVLALLSLVSGIKSALLSGFLNISIADNAETLTEIFINGIKNPTKDGNSKSG